MFNEPKRSFMGKRNAQIAEYLSDPARFADMCNGIYFQGKPVIRSSDLTDADPVLYHAREDKTAQARPDHVKNWRIQGVDYAVLIAEEQNKVDYHMVLRVILSEALHYKKQWKQKQREHRQKMDLKTPEEFLSGMRKNELFTPVVTLVVNLGEKPWEGPRTLFELLDLNPSNTLLRLYVNDYKLNIFDYHDYENFSMFHTELRAIFEFLRFSKDMEKLKKTVETNTELYYNISNETYDLISELTHSRDLLPKLPEEKYTWKGERINMCKALQDLFEEGRTQGISQGISQGIFQHLVELTLRKLAKGKAAVEIAADLDEDPAMIERILSVSQKYAPNYDIPKISSELLAESIGL